MVRVLSFNHEDIDQAFYERRIAIAKDVRMRIGVMKDDNNTYRLVHGEGDNLSGLVIDVYGQTAVVQAHSVGMFRAKKQICEALQTVYGESLKAVYDKSSGTAPFKAGLELVDGYIYIPKEACGNITHQLDHLKEVRPI